MGRETEEIKYDNRIKIKFALKQRSTVSHFITKAPEEGEEKKFEHKKVKQISSLT